MAAGAAGMGGGAAADWGSGAAAGLDLVVGDSAEVASGWAVAGWAAAG